MSRFITSKERAPPLTSTQPKCEITCAQYVFLHIVVVAVKLCSNDSPAMKPKQNKAATAETHQRQRMDLLSVAMFCWPNSSLRTLPKIQTSAYRGGQEGRYARKQLAQMKRRCGVWRLTENPELWVFACNAWACRRRGHGPRHKKTFKMIWTKKRSHITCLNVYSKPKKVCLKHNCNLMTIQ